MARNLGRSRGPQADAPGVRVRRARPGERSDLLDVWLRSVRATHDFVTEADVERLRPKVVEYLASDATEFFVVSADDGAVAGFMGMQGNEIEALFLAPEHFRRGLGTRLIDEARSMRPGSDLVLEVNEQNFGARRFYEARGFVVEGPAELDSEGFPILHMRSPGSR